MNDTGQFRETGSRNLVVTITANFTSEPIADALDFWFKNLGFRSAELLFSGYNQVFQELMDPNAISASNASGVNLFLIRLEDWVREIPEKLREDAIVQITREFVVALENFAVRAHRNTILLICPHSEKISSQPRLSEIFAGLENDIHKSVVRMQNIELIGIKEQIYLYPVSMVEDPESDRIGHIPFSPEYWVAMATALVRRVRTLFLWESNHCHRRAMKSNLCTFYRVVIQENEAVESQAKLQS